MTPVYDLSIPLDFSGPQPVHFGAPRASAEPMRAGSFTGSTARGGSCECATLTLTPHCNGTHTETARHITGHGPAPFEALDQLSYVAQLITVTPVERTETSDKTVPASQAHDLLITAEMVERALEVDSAPPDVSALVVRTLPNDLGKRTADWSKRDAPFFTQDAMRVVVQRRIMHLLFDGPSLDRTHDEGRLLAHRVFFGLPPAGHGTPNTTRSGATVTEMVFAPDTIDDGFYLLSLQVPAFISDAAPSRVLLQRLAP
ncbi:MAG: cyclase family protein [Gammaproteobacteria bacterium]